MRGTRDGAVPSDGRGALRRRLDSNRISALPDVMSALPQLRSLYAFVRSSFGSVVCSSFAPHKNSGLANNTLSALPPSMAAMENLRTLCATCLTRWVAGAMHFLRYGCFPQRFEQQLVLGISAGHLLFERTADADACAQQDQEYSGKHWSDAGPRVAVGAVPISALHPLAKPKKFRSCSMQRSFGQ